VGGVVGTTIGLVGAEAARRAEAEQRAEAERQRDEASRARIDEASQRQVAERQRDEANKQRGYADHARACQHETLAAWSAGENRWFAACKEYGEAVTIEEKLVVDFPDNRAYAFELGKCYYLYAEAVRDHLDPAMSIGWYGKAIKMFEPIYGAIPSVFTGFFLGASHSGRAEALARLGRPAEALADWDRALELRDTSEVRLGRALALANAGQPAQALAAADQLATARKMPAGQLYDVARVYALVAAKLPPADSDRAAAQAIAGFGQALAAGYRDIRRLLTDPDLAALRRRADYAELLWDIADAPSKSPPNQLNP